MVGLVMAVAFLLMFALASHAIRTAVARYGRSTRYVGFALVAAGFCVIALALTFPRALSVELAAGAFCFLLLAGLMLIRLPKMTAQIESASAAFKAAAAEPRRREFEPARDVVATLQEIWSARGALLRLLWPWMLVALAALGATIAIVDVSQTVSHEPPGQALALLFGLLAAIFLCVLAVLLALLQWTRFVATGREPAISDIPLKALWSWTWRLFIFNSVLGGGLDKFAAWLKSQSPSVAHWQVSGMEEFLFWIAIVLASPFAMELPAIAVGTRSALARARAFHLTGRKFYLGVGLIFLPYSVLAWAADSFKGSASLTSDQWLIAVSTGLVLIATAMAAATFVTRIYRAGAATDQVASV